MAETQTPIPDYDAIARQAYEWLKKRRSKKEISTSEIVKKLTGLTWNDLGDFEKAEEFLMKVNNALLRLIKKKNEYVADFSAYEGMFVGLPFNIPFVFRKK